jgi:hypothetical protein
MKTIYEQLKGFSYDYALSFASKCKGWPFDEIKEDAFYLTRDGKITDIHRWVTDNEQLFRQPFRGRNLLQYTRKGYIDISEKDESPDDLVLLLCTLHDIKYNNTHLFKD